MKTVLSARRPVKPSQASQPRNAVSTEAAASMATAPRAGERARRPAVGAPPDAEPREGRVLPPPQARGGHAAQRRLQLARRHGVSALADLAKLTEQPRDVGDGGVGETLEDRAEHAAG